MNGNYKKIFRIISIVFVFLFIISNQAFAATRKPPATKPAPRKTQPKTPEKLEDSAAKSPGAAASPEAIPQARIEEAEQAFTRAWEAFVQRDYWRAMSQLDRAQSANIFLVDVYFLRGLVQRRLGDFDGAQKSLLGFLEVRTRDEVAPYILQGTAENKSDIAALVSQSPYPTRWIVPTVDLYSVFRVFYNRPYSAKGFGKLSGFGADLCFADTLGDRLYTRMKRNEGMFGAMDIEAPVVGLFTGDGTLFTINISGDVYRVSETSADLMGSLGDVTVSDAAFLSAEEIVLTDPVNRRVSLFSFPSLASLDNWAPDNAGEYLFEPVAVDCYGDWAAIADRANGKIHILNLRDYSSFSVEEKTVRDLLWSGLGTLISVNENSEIAAHAIDFAKKSVVRELLRADAKDAWGLFKYENEIFCSNILGTKLWQIKAIPTLSASSGFFSLYYPKLETWQGQSDGFSMLATFTMPFQSWANSMSPAALSIWNNNIIATNITRLPPRTPHAICFARGNVDGLVSSLRVIPTESCADLYANLSATWTNQRDLITNFVLDSRIAYQREDILKLTAFCMFNGIELDIWARSIPSVELVKASAATGGKIYYSLKNRPTFDRLSNGMKSQVVLPFKVAASGYPDRATLSMYMSIGQASARDWMPIWIDLLGK